MAARNMLQLICLSTLISTSFTLQVKTQNGNPSQVDTDTGRNLDPANQSKTQGNNVPVTSALRSGNDNRRNHDGHNNHRKGLVTIFIVVGVVAAILCIVSCIICYCFKVTRQRQEEEESYSSVKTTVSPKSPTSSLALSLDKYQTVASGKMSKISSNYSCQSNDIPYDGNHGNPYATKTRMHMSRADKRDISYMKVSIAPDPDLQQVEEVYALQSSPTEKKANKKDYNETMSPIHMFDVSGALPLARAEALEASGPDDSSSQLQWESEHVTQMAATMMDAGYEECEDRLNVLRQRFYDTLRNKTEQEQLDLIFVTADFSAGIFDHSGGYLDIPHTSISLFIPPGAIPEGRLQEIYIFLTNGASKTTRENLTSPIVRCGPPGVRFQNKIFGVVLSFPSASAQNSKPFRVFTKDSDNDFDHGWTDLTEECADRCFTDGDGNVRLMLNHFSDFKTEKLPEEPNPSQSGLKLCAFGKPFKPSQSTFHMFVCMFDPSEQKRVDHEAANRLGYFPLQDGNALVDVKKGQKITLTVSDITSGWGLMYPDESEQILEVLTDDYITSKCDFDLLSMSNTTKPNATKDLHCRIVASVGAQRVKLPVHVYEGWRCKFRDSGFEDEMKSDVACFSKIDFSRQKTSVESSKSPQEMLGETLYGRIDSKISRCLSAPAYYELCMELNAQHDPPTDWRLLMAELGLDQVKYIHAIEDSKEAGAVVVINLFFSHQRGKEALERLHRACTKVKLKRACDILVKDQPFLQCDVSMVSDNHRRQQFCDASMLQRFIPAEHRGPLPDVTQAASVDSLSHMMSHVKGGNLGDGPPLPLQSDTYKFLPGAAHETVVNYGSDTLYSSQTRV